MSLLLSMIDSKAKENKPPGRFIAHIKTTQENGVLVVENIIENRSQEDIDLSYKFKGTSTGRAGALVRSQSGKARASSGRLVVLSKTSLSFTPTHHYLLYLEIYNKGQQIATRTLSFPGQQG